MERRRSPEFGAIPITLALLGLLALIMLAWSGGLWAWLALGVAILAALTAVGVALARRPARAPAAARPAVEGPGERRRLLVVADVSCGPGTFGDALDPARTDVFVVAPALGSRTARWTNDQSAYAAAERHLAATLDALRELGLEADGHVGPHDPLQAADDGLREFPADELVFVLHPDGRTNWLEHGVVDAARERYPIPVRALALAPG